MKEPRATPAKGGRLACGVVADACAVLPSSRVGIVGPVHPPCRFEIARYAEYVGMDHVRSPHFSAAVDGRMARADVGARHLNELRGERVRCVLESLVLNIDHVRQAHDAQGVVLDGQQHGAR